MNQQHFQCPVKKELLRNLDDVIVFDQPPKRSAAQEMIELGDGCHPA
jgi:hypothetical protein